MSKSPIAFFGKKNERVRRVARPRKSSPTTAPPARGAPLSLSQLRSPVRGASCSATKPAHRRHNCGILDSIFLRHQNFYGIFLRQFSEVRQFSWNQRCTVFPAFVTNRYFPRAEATRWQYRLDRFSHYHCLWIKNNSSTFCTFVGED